MTAQFISSVSGSAINGGSVTLTFGAALPGDVVYVAYATTTLKTMAVTSSSGGAYTTLLTTGNGTGSVLSFGVHRFLQPSPVSLQALCSGTGTATDATAAVGMIFRFASSASPEDATTTSTNGTSVNPDSPSITVATIDDQIISAMATFISTATATVPSSYSNLIFASTTDTRSCAVAMAIATNPSTSAANPGAWTVATSATWCSATVAIRSAYTWDETGVISDKEVITESRTTRINTY